MNFYRSHRSTSTSLAPLGPPYRAPSRAPPRGERCWVRLPTHGRGGLGQRQPERLWAWFRPDFGWILLEFRLDLIRIGFGWIPAGFLLWFDLDLADFDWTLILVKF